MSNITHSRKSPTLRTYKREIIIKECYKLSLNDTQLCSMLVRIMDENDDNIPVVKSASVYSITRIEDSLSIKYIVKINSYHWLMILKPTSLHSPWLLV